MSLLPYSIMFKQSNFSPLMVCEKLEPGAECDGNTSGHIQPNLWFPDNPALADVELITATGKSINLGPQHIFCDMPFTLRLDTRGLAVAAVKLCTFDEKMEVDAAMLSSGPSSPLCSRCRPLLYQIQRQPPFAGQTPPPQIRQTFTDRLVLGVRSGLIYFALTEGLIYFTEDDLIYRL